jgi:hypothetical protein
MSEDSTSEVSKVDIRVNHQTSQGPIPQAYCIVILGLAYVEN